MANLTADERIAIIGTKIERAKKHVIELQAAVSAFLKSNPYRVSCKRDPQTRKLIYYVASVQPVPVCISAIAGDVIQNLRTSLDYLFQHLWMVGTNSTEPGKGMEFKFFVSGNSANQPAEYEGGLKAKIKGLREDAVKMLFDVKAYRGGDGNGNALWQIHELNNIDKHRAMVMVGSAFQSVSLFPVMFRAMKDWHTARGLTYEDMRSLHDATFLRPADRMCPLKAGDELFIDAEDAEPDEKMEFRFNVAISEPQVIEAEPVIETLKQFVDVVGNTVLSFKPCLS